MTRTITLSFLLISFFRLTGQVNDSLPIDLFFKKSDSLSRIEARSFKLYGSPLDTTYYKSGKVKAIQYRGHNEVEFYENGETKSKSVNGSKRKWYPNGQMEYESILIYNHHRDETYWYANGQLEALGSLNWDHNPKTNQGDWFKNKDWKYWKRNGKLKKGKRQ